MFIFFNVGGFKWELVEKHHLKKSPDSETSTNPTNKRVVYMYQKRYIREPIPVMFTRTFHLINSFQRRVKFIKIYWKATEEKEKNTLGSLLRV